MTKFASFQCIRCGARKRSVFCDLDEDHLKTLDAAKTCNVYRPRQVIFYEGNTPCGLYCIASGKAKIYKMDKEGHQQIVRLASPGDIVGYRCLLADQPYSATAETLEPAQVCFIDRLSLLHLFKTHPATTLRVMRFLATDLGNAEQQVVNIVHKNIRERLAELFLVFQKKYGEKTEQGIQLNISLTREEMAELIGTTQESVIRLISEFRGDGLIAVNGREITLLDTRRLAQIASLQD